MRYLLVQEDEDGTEHLWGRCAGAEGLFAEPAPPPPREVLTLRGCAPGGLLADVLSRPEGSFRGLGDMGVEVWQGERPVRWWTLVDAAVLTHRPHPADPARYDVVLGAGVTSEEAPSEPPAEPRFALFTGPGATDAGRCSAVDGLFRTRPEPDPVPMELIGCEPAEPLLAALRRPDRRRPARAGLLVLDRHGAVMASLGIRPELAGVRPSVLGGALVDITLAYGDGHRDRPLPAVRSVWDEWFQGPPTGPNRWAPYDSRGRDAWLELTTRAWRLPAPRPDRSGGEHHLDGRFVTDVPGLHCAMAEALLGPGRYYGREWQTFKDCLCGGFGVAPPFTLVWHDSATARRALAGVVEDPEAGLSYFEEIVRLLEEQGVTVVLR
ncbi:barstar family protein [Streptomyces sp. NPDC088757]|uniref:barstar family protein n=1 Tax=Streptomyces sp. NPDC088757 TaxID=3365889 RepID=UPI0037F66212